MQASERAIRLGLAKASSRFLDDASNKLQAVRIYLPAAREEMGLIGAGFGSGFPVLNGLVWMVGGDDEKDCGKGCSGRLIRSLCARAPAPRINGC